MLMTNEEYYTIYDDYLFSISRSRSNIKPADQTSNRLIKHQTGWSNISWSNIKPADQTSNRLIKHQTGWSKIKPTSKSCSLSQKFIIETSRIKWKSFPPFPPVSANERAIGQYYWPWLSAVRYRHFSCSLLLKPLTKCQVISQKMYNTGLCLLKCQKKHWQNIN